MKKTTKLLAILLAILSLFAFTACASRRVSALHDALDQNGFSGTLDKNAFFALADRFTVDGVKLSELLIYDIDGATSTVKANADDSLTMRFETVPEKDTGYVKTYRQFMSAKPMDGFVLPKELVFGDTLATALDKLTGDDEIDEFVPTKDYDYEMLLFDKDGAKLYYRDMTKDDVEGYRFIYQLRFIEEYRESTDEFSAQVKRTLILSFDNTAKGHPLTQIEVLVESRHKP